jgi:protein-tyrosine phosphatase
MPSRSWWIDEPMVLASSNPSDDELARHRVHGFSVLISLLDEQRQAPRYDKQAASLAGWTVHSLPIEEGGAPSLDRLSQFAALLTALPERTTMLIHCDSGILIMSSLGMGRACPSW